MFKVVISGVNLVEGGILSILQDLLASIVTIQQEFNLNVTVLVHNKILIGEYVNKPGITIVEYPEIKSSWFKRLWFEYFESKNISDKIEPYLWISLHDMTPNVNCKFQVVYCHNPSPFYKLDIRRFFYDVTFSLFCIFYKYLYGFNIKKNAYVIVQQSWLRRAFKKMYGVDTIVAHPLQVVKGNKSDLAVPGHLDINFKKTVFFFPSIPRIFKNFEVICNAAIILEKQVNDFEVVLTLNGTENKYAQEIFKKYGHVECVKFIGVQKREVIQALYNNVDCLIFPSKLETWGLPISEFKEYDKPILVSNLPYAHENIGNYAKAKFFNPSNASELATHMLSVIVGDLRFDKQDIITPDFPFFSSWDTLLPFLISQAKKELNGTTL
jgi:glycosyltransferase involved in cell wall biosynthesis